MQIIASILAEMFGSGELIDQTKYADIAADAATMRRLDGIPSGRGGGDRARLAPRAQGRSDPPARREPAGRARAAGAGDRRAARDRSIRCWRPATWSVASNARCSRPTACSPRTPAGCAASARRSAPACPPRPRSGGSRRRPGVRIGHASDPYLRERLIDLDDIANRLLRHLVGKALQPRSGQPARGHHPGRAQSRRRGSARVRPPQAARRDPRGGLARPPTSRSSPAPSASPWSAGSRVPWAFDPGNLVALDGDSGHVFVRPNDDVLQAFQHAISARVERRRYFDQIRSLPSVTEDGVPITLSINAAFLIDLAGMETVGADGCGLFRTEFAFMIRSRYPDVHAQASHYRDALDTAAVGRSCSGRSTSAATSTCPTGACRPRTIRPWAGELCEWRWTGPR